MKIEVLPEDDMPQLQRDLLARITERFNLWGHDGAALYQMAGLRNRFARDRFVLLLGAIAIEIGTRDIPVADVVRELINFVQQVKGEDND
jgi:hypothetical protein